LNELHLEIGAALVYAGIFILIFALGEIIRYLQPSCPELSRKFIHFAGGLTALTFPRHIQSHWSILCLATGFAAVLVLAKMKGLLRSVHGIERKSYGAMLFPVSVYLLFLLGQSRTILYFVSILVMTVSDTLAAVIGDRYGSIRYEVEGVTKSLEGSTVFFFVTFLCVHISLLLMTPTGRLESVLMAFVIAVLITAFEAVSPTGSDNFFVPLGTFFILGNMMKQPLPAMLNRIGILLAMMVATAILTAKIKLFKTTGLIGMILVNYAAWTLAGVTWFLPLLLGQILLYGLVAYFVDKVTEGITGYQIKFLFYAVLLPVLLIFAANALHARLTFFLPYVTSITTTLAIIGYFFLAILKPCQDEWLRCLARNRALSILCCAGLSVAGVCLIPIFFHGQAVIVSLFIVFGATSFALCLFHFLFQKMGLGLQIVLRQRVRLLCSLIAVALVFLLQEFAFSS
jgi:phytol kinase